ncbi:hypothetical protein VTK26DRAFT_8131 [Humicola hyalothermophila]
MNLGRARRASLQVPCDLVALAPWRCNPSNEKAARGIRRPAAARRSSPGRALGPMGRGSSLGGTRRSGQATGPGRFICHAQFRVTCTPPRPSPASDKLIKCPASGALAGEPQHRIRCLAQILRCRERTGPST